MVQLLLQGIGEIVLFSEEYNATFRDYTTLSQGSLIEPQCKHTGDSKVTNELIGVGSVQKILNDVDIQELATDDRSCFLIAELLKCTRLLERFGVRRLICRRHCWFRVLV
jgi:hypothetical protein